MHASWSVTRPAHWANGPNRNRAKLFQTRFKPAGTAYFNNSRLSCAVKALNKSIISCIFIKLSHIIHLYAFLFLLEFRSLLTQFRDPSLLFPFSIIEWDGPPWAHMSGLPSDTRSSRPIESRPAHITNPAHCCDVSRGKILTFNPDLLLSTHFAPRTLHTTTYLHYWDRSVIYIQDHEALIHEVNIDSMLLCQSCCINKLVGLTWWFRERIFLINN